MDLYTPRAARGLLNMPLAMHDRTIANLCDAITGQLDGQARVRGLGAIPEVEAHAALAQMRGLSADTTERRRRPYQISTTGIAHIVINGDLVRTCDIWDMIFGGVVSYDFICDQILFASEDADCRAIFIQINSFGGVTDGMTECGDFIYSMSARFGGKPIYAYAADNAMSAAYLIFAACDEGYVGETGGVGSIGVKAIYLDRSRMLEEAGIDPKVFRSRPGKALRSGIEPLPQSEIERTQEQIDYLGSVFEGRVVRYLPRLTQQAVADTNALDYIGPRAKAIGLVNDVLSMPEAWAKLERHIAVR